MFLTDDGLGRRKLPKVVDPHLAKDGMPANSTVNTRSDQGDYFNLNKCFDSNTDVLQYFRFHIYVFFMTKSS